MAALKDFNKGTTECGQGATLMFRDPNSGTKPGTESKSEAEDQ